jgi:hypothetical protein
VNAMRNNEGVFFSEKFQNEFFEIDAATRNAFSRLLDAMGQKRGQTPKKLDILMYPMLSYLVSVRVNQSYRKETMRTTIYVDDQLLMQAKAQAATLGVTLAQLIEDALRESLMRRQTVEHRERVRLITMKGTGTRPGIDLDNSQSLLEIMER